MSISLTACSDDDDDETKQEDETYTLAGTNWVNSYMNGYSEATLTFTSDNTGTISIVEGVNSTGSSRWEDSESFTYTMSDSNSGTMTIAGWGGLTYSFHINGTTTTMVLTREGTEGLVAYSYGSNFTKQ